MSATMVQSVYLEFPGHWNKTYEKAYQDLRGTFEPSIRAGKDLTEFERLVTNATPEELQTAFRQYEDLRFGRLCSLLRAREPDDEVGNSILIFRLSDGEVARALDGEPCELLAQPETESKK